MSGFEAEQAHRLLKVAPVLFCTAGLNGRFLALSDQWETLVGLPKEQLLADPYRRGTPGDHSRSRSTADSERTRDRTRPSAPARASARSKIPKW